MGKLLDAYQEDLIQLEQLRQRMPELRKREQALRSELESLEATAADQEIFLRLAAGLESFLTRLRQSADTMSVMERQKVLRLVVKEIHVGRSTIQIKHSIPTNSSDRIGGSTEPPKTPSYLLRSGSRGAHLEGLIRLSSGQFELAQAASLNDYADVWMQKMIPLEELLPELPRLDLTLEEVNRIAHGNPVPFSQGKMKNYRLFHLGLIYAIGRMEKGFLLPFVVLRTELNSG